MVLLLRKRMAHIRRILWRTKRKIGCGDDEEEKEPVHCGTKNGFAVASIVIVDQKYEEKIVIRHLAPKVKR